MFLCASVARADAGSDWLGSQAAQAFAQRVVDLALLYNEGSGLDPEGYRIDTRVTGERLLGCAEVLMVISKDGKEIRRETLPACKQN